MTLVRRVRNTVRIPGLFEARRQGGSRPISRVLSLGNHSSGTTVTGGLKQPTRKRRGPRHRFPIWPCSGWGLPCRSVLPPARCALTAPFHPYPTHRAGRYIFCCTFRRLTPPRCYLAPCPAEPGLSSPPRSNRAERLPGRLPGQFSSINAARAKKSRGRNQSSSSSRYRSRRETP